jgi:hypothetical protein
MDRMITLCHPCHMSLEAVREKVARGLHDMHSGAN